MTGYLVDENLPVDALTGTALPTFHATHVGLRCSDDQLWDFAKSRDLVIVTQDLDFSARMLRSTPPPRVVHLRTGNLRRLELIRFLSENWPQVERMLGENKLIYLYGDRMVGIPEK